MKSIIKIDQLFTFQQPLFLSLFELITELFALGIFSVEEGPKAWFELILVTAALCGACSMVWWQTVFVLLSIFLATLAAGMFSVLSPQYLKANNQGVDQQIVSKLNKISQKTLKEIPKLSETEANIRLKKLAKFNKKISSYQNLVDLIPEIQDTFDNLEVAYEDIREKVDKYEELREEERKKREKEERDYWKYVYSERSKKNLEFGVPPNRSNQCPWDFPIRATANLNNFDARGIYYFGDERIGVDVYWCFADEDEARASNFRRPKKKPPKQQPR
ncbi:hypothetical protein Lepto7376_3867 [[Leptolyngbya] sp. PCC 7376]|uniref:hypothetical protein n=1 Tax=[Leptolyngbya] sp. PCC 7376 TaxID=111781 RepID=UPI00029F3824|nr:hypothetical protein [[Leptolyngbya] sp. PCC 7376]AFY40023.1 hypothetical protein Lepto7376_3867 [[Leptolyngbya] sp. PCC 7376]